MPRVKKSMPRKTDAFGSRGKKPPEPADPQAQKDVETFFEGAAVLASGKPLTILTVNDRTCKWPIGSPADRSFHFCGLKPKKGKPYCEAHCRRAYQPQGSRRKD